MPAVESGGKVESRPPNGYLRVLNIYIDPVTGKLVIEYEDEEE